MVILLFAINMYSYEDIYFTLNTKYDNTQF